MGSIRQAVAVTSVARLAVAVAVALAALGVPAAASPAAAAEDDLRLTVATTYTVQPEDGVVRVLMDVSATNLAAPRTTSTTVTSFYYDVLEFGLQDEAENVRATQGGTRLRVTVEGDDGFQGLTVRLARRLLYRQTARVRITFNLPGGPPRSNSAIRVGQAYATFYAWAWGDAGRASVRISIPSSYDVERAGERLARTEADGRTILSADSIADPTAWYASIDARRPSQLTRDRLDLGDGQRLTIRAWPEDEEWRDEVTDLMRRGLPVLEDLIGLDWPVEGELSVTEVHTPDLEGYAGVYYTDRDEIEIGEDLDDITILHEASHAWFNDALWSGRWIGEGFADTYAALANDEIGGAGFAPQRADRRDRGFLPLNEWTHPGVIADEETDDRESYGYNASWWLVDALVREIGEERMRAVLDAAEARTIAYVGAPAPETQGGAANWRRFLDLLEEVGGSNKATELFRSWVVSDSQKETLDARADARAEYARLLHAADGWEAPYAVRSKLAYWEFHRLGDVLAEAHELLEIRDELHADATALGLEPPDSLEAAWEGASSDFGAAQELAEDQRAGLDAIEEAAAAVGRPRDVLVELGLWGAPVPEQDLGEAKDAWEADAHDTVLFEAAAAQAVLLAAADVGRTRALLAVAAVWIVLLGVLAVLLLRRRRRRRLAEALAATAPAGSYATLAPDPGNLPDPGAPGPEPPASGVPDPSSSPPNA
jgi:hypothetical protein